MRNWGLRISILVALLGLALCAFLPLFYAVSKLSRQALAIEHERTARAYQTMLVEGVARLAERDWDEAISMVKLHAREVSFARMESNGRIFSTGQMDNTPLVSVPLSHGAITIAFSRHAVSSEEGALVGLVGLYTTGFAVLLMLMLHALLTRLAVNPVRALAGAASRIDSGESARFDAAVIGGAREFFELARLLESTSQKLVDREQSLKQRVKELEQAQRALVVSERQAIVGRLAAGLAHEVGNPIAAMLGIEELLLADDCPMDDESRDLVQRMKHETERVHRVIRSLLDFARARPKNSTDPAQRDGKPNLEDDHADLKTVLHYVIALVRPQRNFKDIEIVVAIDQAVGPVAMSSEHLEQVLLNLFLNAADALIDAPKKRIEVAVSRASDTITMDVCDSGTGVPPSIAQSIFEPFFTTKDAQKGTGLGLSVCRGLLEADRGSIECLPCDTGALFRVTLRALGADKPREVLG